MTKPRQVYRQVYTISGYSLQLLLPSGVATAFVLAR